MAYTVAIYLIDRAFGGHEEGGWYYDCGVISDEYAQYTKGFVDEDDACEYARQLNDTEVQTMNEGRRPISSVLSEGRYAALVHEGAAPHHYPDSRPHYE